MTALTLEKAERLPRAATARPGWVRGAILFAIVAGCRAGEKRVIELCDRFGKVVTHCEFSIAVRNDADREILRGIAKDIHSDGAKT